jgi:hypothetical protein
MLTNLIFVVLVVSSIYVISTVTKVPFAFILVANTFFKSIIVLSAFYAGVSINASFLVVLTTIVVISVSNFTSLRENVLISSSILAPILFVNFVDSCDLQLIGVIGYCAVLLIVISEFATSLLLFALVAVLLTGIPVNFVNLTKLISVSFSEFLDFTPVLLSYVLLLGIFAALVKSQVSQQAIMSSGWPLLTVYRPRI